MKVGRCTMGLASLALATTVSAYDLGTHARLTFWATYSSNLNSDSSIFRDLGFAQGSLTDLSNIYYDVSGSTTFLRLISSYATSNSRMIPFSNVPPGTDIAGWLMRGAIREDDGPTARIFDPATYPSDDPFGIISRYCNHFFNPLLNRPLSEFCPFVGSDLRMAPLWALGALNPFVAPASLTSPDPNRRNHFTVYDAREAMWRALTGYDRSLLTAVSVSSATKVAP